MSATRNSAEISRRKFLKASAGGAAGLAGFTLLSSNSSAAQLIARALSGGTALVHPFNAGWLFGEQYTSGSEQPSFDDSAFAAVNLPHAVVPLSWENWDAASWEQVWIYRRHFDLPREFQNLRTFVEFEGALVTATPTINGTTLPAHQVATCRSATNSPISCRRAATCWPSSSTQPGSRFHPTEPDPGHPASTSSSRLVSIAT
jgi:hypothetical protein